MAENPDNRVPVAGKDGKTMLRREKLPHRQRFDELMAQPETFPVVNLAKAKADAVIRLLLEWADWQKGYRMKIGYPRRAAGFSSGGIVTDETSSDDYSSSDNIRNEIVDCCIDGLIPVQKAAIYHRYCAAVFRMREYEVSLMHAHDMLAHRFRAKGVLW